MYTPQQENSKVNRQKKSGQLQGSNKASLEPKAKKPKKKKKKKDTQEKGGGKNRDHGGKGGEKPAKSQIKLGQAS
jgi:hypothetical protein